MKGLSYSEAKQSNFVENSIESEGVVCSESEKMILEQCVLVNNKASPVLYVTEFRTYTMTVINCTIPPEEMEITRSQFNIKNWEPVPSSFMNALNYVFLSDLCRGPLITPYVYISGLFHHISLSLGVIILSPY